MTSQINFLLNVRQAMIVLFAKRKKRKKDKTHGSFILTASHNILRSSLGGVLLSLNCTLILKFDWN